MIEESLSVEGDRDEEVLANDRNLLEFRNELEVWV